ncbi:MAG: PAS domain S-box protein [Bacteroidota bacterium]
MINEKEKTILLVEDDAIIAMMEVMTLQKYGFNVITVDTGEKAIESVNKNSDIDLILMDINLNKGMDGTQAAVLILEKHTLPLIFLSSHTEREIVEKTEGITSYGYIVKNTGDTVLIASIKMAFRLFESRIREMESDAFRKRIFESSMTPIIVMDSLTFKYIDCNPAAVSIYGFASLEETLSKTLFDVSANYQYDGIDSFVKARQYVSTAIADGQLVFEWQHQLPDGKLWDAEVHLMSFYSKDQLFLQFTLKDITEQKKVENTLRESEARYKALFNCAAEGILVADLEDKKFRYANPAICRMFNYSNEEIIGLGVNDIHPKESLNLVLAEFDAQAKGAKTLAHDLPCLRKDGTIFYADINTTPIVLDGCNCNIGFFSDITQRKLAAEENKYLLQEKTLLLKEVNHRIKNNITSIVNLLTIHSGSIKNSEASSFILDAIDRIKSMQFLYDSLIIRENYFDISSKVYFEKLIDTIISLFQNAEKIVIEKNISDFIISSKVIVPIGIIVNEIITNAMKYAFVGKEQGILKISISRVENKISIIIADNGIGLPNEFDENGNNGFGYALIEMLIRQIGASFKKESNMGTKCTIEYELPCYEIALQ